MASLLVLGQISGMIELCVFLVVVFFFKQYLDVTLGSWMICL